MPGAVRLLQASCRSCLSAVFALAADVAPLHRFVPDECVFSFQGAFFFSLCNNSVVTSHILEETQLYFYELRHPFRAFLWLSYIHQRSNSFKTPVRLLITPCSRALISIESILFPTSRKSVLTPKKSESSSSKSIEHPSLPFSILFRCP